MKFKPKYTITDEIANSLTVIERARGFLQGRYNIRRVGEGHGKAGLPS